MKGRARPAPTSSSSSDDDPPSYEGLHERLLETLWMRCIALGDMTVYRAVLDAYMPDVYRFTFSILRDPDRAQDATQETFLRLWTHAAGWQPTGPIKSWLFKIAHHLCIDDIRARKDDIDIDKVQAVLADKAQGPREAIIEAQNARIVRAALTKLPARQRMAVTMVYYLDHTRADTAAFMEMTPDALESLLRRGQARLKKILQDRKDVLLSK